MPLNTRVMALEAIGESAAYWRPQRSSIDPAAPDRLRLKSRHESLLGVSQRWATTRSNRSLDQMTEAALGPTAVLRACTQLVFVEATPKMQTFEDELDRRGHHRWLGCIEVVAVE